jgi:hypothetical protein
MKAKLVRENINFERGKDPKETMGLGQRTLIKKWFDSVGVNPDEYTIDKDLNISVGGDLFLVGKQITKLPDNLSVGGWLDLRRTQITKLPDNLSVGGWLDLRDTQITELPDNLRVGRKIYKDF